MNKTSSTAIVIAAFTANCGAVEINVPNDYPSITAALAAALDGDVITVNPGVWAENVLING